VVIITTTLVIITKVKSFIFDAQEGPSCAGEKRGGGFKRQNSKWSSAEYLIHWKNIHHYFNQIELTSNKLECLLSNT
jgi:hypothetical protein